MDSVNGKRLAELSRRGEFGVLFHVFVHIAADSIADPVDRSKDMVKRF